ncbi:hypothetical protein C8Q75DRAFT_808782 [Abortiporus biennis]|nr:hypothetical protein C8Q75DRAFT_808782 [Abortiporus biennis]
MPAPGPQGSHRKTLAVKHADGEPLTRVDLQYDLLYYLFADTRAVFTDPYETVHGAPRGTKVTFRDLYVNAIIHAPRCSKVTKAKLRDTPEFANEFAKISILSNVGRIDTTMAFFPEMQTALRTYHPVPSLQKTDGNLQDAPRIKNILKSCYLQKESDSPLDSPAAVLAHSRSGNVPPTTIVNLLFMFANHAAVLASTHFGSNLAIDFLDFFCPINISSESRARAILWLCYHYLEAPSVNPFDDDYSRSHPGKTPKLTVLSNDEFLLENVDPPEERAWGEKMLQQRKTFMATKDLENDSQDEVGGNRTKRAKGRRRRGKPKAEARKKSPVIQKKTKEPPTAPGEVLLSFHHQDDNIPQDREGSSSPSESTRLAHRHIVSPHPRRALSRQTFQHDGFDDVEEPQPRSFSDPYPRPFLAISPLTQSTHGGPVRSHSNKIVLPPLRYALSHTPITQSSSRSSRSDGQMSSLSSGPPRMPPHRTIFEQAYHYISTKDPLADSENEESGDENTRRDLEQRLCIINRLRGKAPTPEPDRPMHSIPFTRHYH